MIPVVSTRRLRKYDWPLKIKRPYIYQTEASMSLSSRLSLPIQVNTSGDEK